MSEKRRTSFNFEYNLLKRNPIRFTLNESAKSNYKKRVKFLQNSRGLFKGLCIIMNYESTMMNYCSFNNSRSFFIPRVAFSVITVKL